MCSFQPLFKHTSNFAVRCPECKNIQLVFGNIQITFSEWEFIQFTQKIEERLLNLENVNLSEKKVFPISTHSADINLILTFQELKNLWYNLQESSHILKVYRILD